VFPLIGVKPVCVVLSIWTVHFCSGLYFILWFVLSIWYFCSV